MCAADLKDTLWLSECGVCPSTFGGFYASYIVNQFKFSECADGLQRFKPEYSVKVQAVHVYCCPRQHCFALLLTN